MNHLDCQRDLFSLEPGLHYLNCAFMAPISNQVSLAARTALEKLQTPSQLGPEDFFNQSNKVRQLFARLIGVETSQRVAIVPSVSYAMATIAKNSRIQSSENVVIVSEQFPSNVYTWKRACEKTGAELRTVSPPKTTNNRGQDWNEALLDAIDTKTAMVAIPELHWTDGTRFNLDHIGRRAHECGALFVLDGTQSIGALPFSIFDTQADAVVCAGYKWLLGPYSIGLAYYGPAFDNGVPLEENWITRMGSEEFSSLVRYTDIYQPGSIRYDVGERSNFLLLPMLQAGLNHVIDWGPSLIQDYCQRISNQAVNELRELGCSIEAEHARAAHLFGVRLPPKTALGGLADRFRAHKVSTSLRGTAIRVSPHVYNNAEDISALVAAVREEIVGHTS